jgi:hypothetical protein
MDLARAGVHTAARVLLLAGRSLADSPSSSSSRSRLLAADADISHDSLTIFTAQSIRSSLLDAAPPIIMELRQPLHLELVVAMTASVNAAIHASKAAERRRRKRMRRRRWLSSLLARNKQSSAVGSSLPPREVTLAKMSPLLRRLATGDTRDGGGRERHPESEGNTERDPGSSSDSDQDKEGGGPETEADEEDEVFALPDMADGTVYASTLMEGLMAKSFFDANAAPIVTALVSGRGASISLVAVPRDPRIVRRRLCVIEETEASAASAHGKPDWLAAPATPELILPDEPLLYQELYEYYVAFGLLPLAILRHGRQAALLTRPQHPRDGAAAPTPAGVAESPWLAELAGLHRVPATGIDAFRLQRESEAAAVAVSAKSATRPYVYSSPSMQCRVTSEDCIYVVAHPLLNSSKLFAATITLQRAMRDAHHRRRSAKRSSSHV